MAIVVLAGALTQRQALLAELQSEATILHRQASQRADQHDAHLTSLSALAVAGAEERPDLFLDVAATIQRFYPRIEAIDLVPLDGEGIALSTRPTGTGALAGAIRAAARQSTGQPVLLPLPAPEGRYLIVKRSPNSDAARHGLAMQIDMHALLLSDSPFWKRPSVSQAIHLAMRRHLRPMRLCRGLRKPWAAPRSRWCFRPASRRTLPTCFGPRRWPWRRQSPRRCILRRCWAFARWRGRGGPNKAPGSARKRRALPTHRG